MGKGEIAHNEQFLRFPQCFLQFWRLIVDCKVFNAVFNSIQLNHGRQCTYLCFPGILLTSTPHNILSKPLATFPRNNCGNNGQRRDRNDFCRNDYHQSSEEYLPSRRSNQRPLVLKSAMLMTEHGRIQRGGPGVRIPLEFWQKCAYRIREMVHVLV